MIVRERRLPIRMCIVRSNRAILMERDEHVRIVDGPNKRLTLFHGIVERLRQVMRDESSQQPESA